jgi:hypothetical protein
MTGFDLPSNFHDNLESLVRRARPRVLIPQKFLSSQYYRHHLIITDGREDDP